MTKKEDILAAIGPKGIVDLYHIMSAPMWMILDGMILVKHPAARLISPRDFTRQGFTQVEAGIKLKLEGWGIVPVYGLTYYK